MTEKARRIREAAQEAEEQSIRALQEEGELGHLRGKPLDLSDDSPNWFATKLLKREGYSHPLIERGRDVDVAQREVDAILESLNTSRQRLTRAGMHLTREQAEGFNTHREMALEEYREALIGLNRVISFHNLAVPEALHRNPILVHDAVQRAAEAVPPLEVPDMPRQEPSGWRKLRDRLRPRSRGSDLQQA